MLHGVTQTRLGAPDGNCLEAAIATLLQIPIDAVPDLRAVNGHLPEAARWELARRRRPVLQRWLASHGLRLVGGSGFPPPEHAGWYIASGPGPRGLRHAVVYSQGQLAWDPHPDRTGLYYADGWTAIERLEG